MRTQLLTCLLLPVLILACDDEPARARADGSGGLEIGSTGVTTNALRDAVARLSVCYRSNLGQYYEAVLETSQLQGPAAQIFAGQVACVNAGADCDAALECIGIRLNTCVVDTFSCDGDVAVECFEDERGRTIEQRRDCAADPNGNTRCHADDIECVGPDACEVSGCEGDIAINCFDGAAYLTDCAQEGLTCSETQGQPNCMPAEQVRCDAICVGDVARTCVEGVVARTYDCALLGFVCNEDPMTRAPCVPAESVCERGESRCAGDVAEVCFLGAWFAFDCAAAGGQCGLDTEMIAECRLAQ